MYGFTVLYKLDSLESLIKSAIISRSLLLSIHSVWGLLTISRSIVLLNWNWWWNTNRLIILNPWLIVWQQRTIVELRNLLLRNCLLSAWRLIKGSCRFGNWIGWLFLKLFRQLYSSNLTFISLRCSLS